MILLLGKGLQRPTIIPVDFGSGATPEAGAEETIRYANKRAQMAGRCRSWLARGCLDKSPGFLKEAIAIGYKFRGETTILLESKEQVKTRLHDQSTDDFDSFILTFAEIFNIEVQQPRGSLRHARHKAFVPPDNNYNPFEESRIYH